MIIDTRDKARELIAEAGITTANVTEEQLSALRGYINSRMIISSNYRDSYRMNDEVSPFMTCRTDQWDKREAVSFNRDGFIGLAGWADDVNIKPILQGIGDWLIAAHNAELTRAQLGAKRNSDASGVMLNDGLYFYD